MSLKNGFWGHVRGTFSSFWEGLFSSAILVWGSVFPFVCGYVQNFGGALDDWYKGGWWCFCMFLVGRVWSLKSWYLYIYLFFFFVSANLIEGNNMFRTKDRCTLMFWWCWSHLEFLNLTHVPLLDIGHITLRIWNWPCHWCCVVVMFVGRTWTTFKRSCHRKSTDPCYQHAEVASGIGFGKGGGQASWLVVSRASLFWIIALIEVFLIFRVLRTEDPSNMRALLLGFSQT